MIYGLVGAVLASILVFAIMEVVYRNKLKQVEQVNDDIMDDSFENL